MAVCQPANAIMGLAGKPDFYRPIGRVNLCDVNGHRLFLAEYLWPVKWWGLLFDKLLGLWFYVVMAIKIPTMETTYAVEVLRSGQPRPYADTEREYRITVKATGWGNGKQPKPWLMHGDVEKRIVEEEALRKAGKMYGGTPPDELRKQQREWAKMIVRALCQNFREKDDDDGRKDMEAHFYPTLRSLKLDATAGTIHAFIIEPFTD